LDDEDDDDDDDEDDIYVTSKPIPKEILEKALKLKKTPKPSTTLREEESQYNSPVTKSLGKVNAEREASKIRLISEDDDVEVDEMPHHHKKKEHGSPMAINIILGLCCGILVVMLIVVIVMVVQRRRVAHTRVVIAENDDREHLVQMQKNGFENPTYKFFYY